MSGFGTRIAAAVLFSSVALTACATGSGGRAADQPTSMWAASTMAGCMALS